MISIQQAVDRLISSRPFMEEALYEGLLNLSSVARRLQSELEELLGKRVQTGAIVMALRRHVPGKLHQLRSKNRKSVNRINKMTVRAGICSYTYHNFPGLMRHLQILTHAFQEKDAEFFTFSMGVFETSVFVHESAAKFVQEVFHDKECVASYKNLSCITLNLPDDNAESPGYYYSILKRIAWEGINIREVLSTTNEFSLMLDEKDVDQVFAVLNKPVVL